LRPFPSETLGKWDYRGNCSGHLLVDLIKQYQPKNILDPMSGSYTTRDVCGELGVECDAYDLHEGFDALTDVLPPKKYYLVFLHPPYHSMIKYSDDARDLSNCASVSEYGNLTTHSHLLKSWIILNITFVS
jgi:hypothetical protein